MRLLQAGAAAVLDRVMLLTLMNRAIAFVSSRKVLAPPEAAAKGAMAPSM